jgi:non-specific serine/threonine protein kinase
LPVAVPGQPAPFSSPLRFGPSGRFELQPAERRLLVDGRPANLGGRALDLLITLAANPDHLLTKNELLDRVWPGLVVEEANLQMQISNLRKLLGGDVIATVPGRGYRFTARIESAAPPQPAPISARAPAQAAAPGQRLVGRDADLAVLENMLQAGGCMTLVGTAGVGKTSLARAAAERWNGRSVWVDLATLPAGSQVTGALARALGLQGDAAGLPQILGALQDGSLLLVLDNAEHLIQACAELVSKVRALPDLRVLVTSQLPLAVAGERVQRLEPLALSVPSDPTADLGDGALALLVARIVGANHRFRVTAASLVLLGAICTHLDGLPLALEMAAARVPHMGLQAVHDALAQRFALLTRGHRDAATRHRTLHNALEWSYELLADSERRLFRAVGVFAGGFSLDLAVALMTNDSDARWDIIDGLATLAERSLVVVSSDEPPRYRLLETMRAFALEQLALAREESAVRRSHAAAVLALFAAHVAGNATTLALCTPELENARDATAWAQVHDLELAAQLSARASNVATFTVWRTDCTNWMRALEPLLEHAPGDVLPADVQANWWGQYARMLTMVIDTRAKAAAKRALALWEPLQQPRQSLFASMVHVRANYEPGRELDEACADLKARLPSVPDLTPREKLLVHGALVRADLVRGDDAAVLEGRFVELELAREFGDVGSIEAAESNIVLALNGVGRYAEAAERGYALLARIDRTSGEGDGNLPWAILGLLEALVKGGRLDEARALAPRAWSAYGRFAVPQILPHLAALAAGQGRFAAAARLIGHCRQHYASRNTKFVDWDEGVLARTCTMATEALGAPRVEALIEEGRSLSDQEGEALAIGDTP